MSGYEHAGSLSRCHDLNGTNPLLMLSVTPVYASAVKRLVFKSVQASFRLCLVALSENLCAAGGFCEIQSVHAHVS